MLTHLGQFLLDGMCNCGADCRMGYFFMSGTEGFEARSLSLEMLVAGVVWTIGRVVLMVAAER